MASDTPPVPITAAMDLLEKVVVKGDLNQLTSAERMTYYKTICESVGLNPLTRPFEYLTLNGRLTLYARKDATDQLRELHGVSITKLERETTEGIYCVTAYATNARGRTDSSIGAVSIEGLRGEAKANAIMKAETKGKRRVTLSLCGLGMLDETEVETISGALTGEPLSTVVETRRPPAATGPTTLTPDSLLSGAVTGEDTDGPPPRERSEPPPDADMARPLALSLIQTLRDKVPPAVWTNVLRTRGVGIDTLGRTDLVVLEEVVRDLQAVVAKARK